MRSVNVFANPPGELLLRVEYWENDVLWLTAQMNGLDPHEARLMTAFIIDGVDGYVRAKDVKVREEVWDGHWG